ncbi:MAG: hypothetical protein IID45_10030 [Planctomycetes bacterium]|nr:hypothetical protein [Planctomycetota bacterium]
MMTRSLAAMGLLTVGYVLGTTHAWRPQQALAQPAAADASTEDKVKAAQQALKVAQEALVADKKYSLVITGTNAFATTVGGVDALADLQAGRGVDPETYAGLYAGQATPEISKDLKKDDKNRLMYKNRVVRMYSIARLKILYARRGELDGGTALTPNP